MGHAWGQRALTHQTSSLAARSGAQALEVLRVAAEVTSWGRELAKCVSEAFAYLIKLGLAGLGTLAQALGWVLVGLPGLAWEAARGGGSGVRGCCRMCRRRQDASTGEATRRPGHRAYTGS